MLLQTLSTLVILLLLAGGLLTSALLSAKVALHRTMTRQVQVSLARGTDDFTRWAADYVYKHHADAVWPASSQSLSPQPVCPQQQDIDPQSQSTCTLSETTSYRVTGSTAAAIANGVNGAAGSAQDVAENLQTAINEQRISAELTSTITNSDGTVLGSGTRELTVRVFDVPPWAVVTGTRDLSSVLGSTHAVEGDTGGVALGNGLADANQVPTFSSPSSFKSTIIRVDMTCVNSIANSNQNDAHSDNKAPGNNYMPWGVQATASAYETPCTPKYLLDQQHSVPDGASIPSDGEYDVGSYSQPKTWHNGETTPQNTWTQ